jgi:uncharacterized protein (TIGR03083 family)
MSVDASSDSARPTRTDLVAALAAGRDRLSAAARSAGPEARVPMSSRWTVRDLVIHAGNVHDWAASVLRTRVEQPQAFDAEPDGVGESFSALLQWYADRAGDLLDLLTGDEVPDDTPMWTFGPPGTAAFWPRRQAHEITMHSVDGAMASGEALSDAVLPLDPQVSADGVDEVFTVMMPRVAMFVPRPALPGRLAVEATDTGHRWELERDGRIDSAATGSAVDATLAGPASGLFAVLWRRGTLDADGADLGVEVTGARDVVDALFAARLTP